ncbi:MAG TPA: sigma-70 family RNA polymerase sigma factor [Thermoanaerobaculia bacterium]|nr:sigma-70 family RNA polymerase sigma factor [Thermoanaerobaculia bacterium]
MIKPLAALDDRTLLTRVAARDGRAFEALYQRYYGRLFSYLLRLTRRADLVEEAVNDVFFVIWQSAARFDGRSQPSSWILGIAYRKGLKALSRLPAQAPRDLSGALEVEEEPAAGPESRALEREKARQLGRALASLTPEHRAVVELTFYEGCSYREISDIVGCPVNTVKTRMFHARRRLRQLLDGLGLAERESTG